MPERKQLFFWNNQNLFSNNYLEHRLPTNSLWKEQEAKAGEVFEVIKNAYAAIKPLNLGTGQEAELEDKFIRPVLKALGYDYTVQPVAQRGFKKKRPDYALFKDSNSLKKASGDRDNLQKIFSQALTILEAKSWGRRLNDTDPKDTLDTRDPTAQTVKYLDDVYHASQGRIQWAILTNGKEWRLFYYRAASRSGNFFEINLENIITENDREKFLYFYIFFSKNAFIPDLATGKTWLDLHLDGSEAYAKAVSDRLKELIFDEVFEGLAEGFIHYRRTELSISEETNESKKEIFKGCLTFLYRLLFLLYAESRNLLPVEEDSYRRVSLKKLKQDIYSDLGTTEPDKMSKRSYAYWARLEGLFDIIAKGDPELNVPIYNGGLFENNPTIPPLAKGGKGGFLATHKIPDPYLAKVVKLLTVDQEDKYMPGAIPFIDYSSLNVRHLGDIYEGLLEFHIQIADEDMVEVRESGRSIWKKLSEVKTGAKTNRKKTKGEVYIENSRHERKATGSYYTPHYIVEYIVKNTVNSVLEERFKTGAELLTQFEQAIKASNKQKSTDSIRGYRSKILEIEEALFNTIFDIKVLDPAMGSGHFLVHTVDFISDKIISYLAEYPGNPVIKKIADLKKEIISEINRQGVRIDESKLTEVNLIKRMVMKRCIYGVDLNEMAVELAKLSLWLDSFTLGAPLSFLDHHLKCGNSLIGILDISSVIIPNTESYGKVQRALSFMLQVSDLTDATISEAKKSYDLFGHAQQEIEPIKRRFNVATAKHFTDLGKNIGRLEQLAYTLAFDKEAFPENVERCKRALSIAKGKKFFHWKLEFPEVFYTERGEKENPGFNCVIGNPPWGAAFSFEEKAYLIEKFNNVHLRATESANYFIGLSSFISRTKGLVGYIVPNIILYQHEFRKTREALLKENALQSVLNLGDGVFDDVTAPCCIMVWLCAIKPDTPFDRFYYQDFRNVSKDILESDFNASLKPSQFAASDILKVEGAVFQADTASLSIIAKATTISVKLGDISSEVASGIGTGGDNIYRLPNQRITADRLEKDMIYPVLVGGEIYPYYVPEDSGHSILYINKDFDPKNHPKTYSYLLPYKEKLSQKREAKKGLIPWYSLHWPRNPELFNAPKIVCRQTADTLIAAVDEKGFYTLDSILIIQISETRYDLKFVTSLLNSKLLRYIYKSLTQEVDRVYAQVKPINLRKLPIPRISFTTPEAERKERLEEFKGMYRKCLESLASNSDLCQNNKHEKADEHKKPSTESGKMAGKPQRYKLSAEGISGEGFGLGGKVHGVREGTGGYKPAEGTSQPLDSTRHLETYQGIKPYSEVAETIAVSVAKTIQEIIAGQPEKINITPEWICSLHKNIAGSLFDWAGKFRDLNVQVGAHMPPPFYEVPVAMRLYCDDLSARISHTEKTKDVKEITEILAWADWRFQWIHPFRDFNGRVGRVLLTAILFRLKLPPAETASTEPKEKTEYLKALHLADAGDLTGLIHIWLKRLSNSAQEKEE